MKKYICPVCGYPDLEDPPYDSHGDPSFDICPCCGCEYGYHDASLTARDNHLVRWLKKGAPWREPELKPSNWDVNAQLRNIGITFDGETIVVDGGAGTF